ncbi:uncharacterized protein [Palaemon carinicauda]|uniref:uncharacterized protein n=1 Tax=Palaemon carinicauda TaxID=392227 RepID=UPI0035B61408
MNQAKEDWIGKQCTEIEEKLEKNNSRRAFQIVKDLTKPKEARVSTIQDKAGNCLTEEEDILKRWTEYCSDLYNYQTNGDPNVTSCHKSSNNDDFPVLREEVEEAIRSLKHGKAAGAEEIIAEEQAGFRRGRSTTEQIFNLRVLCEKYSQHQQDIFHVFIDYKKAFDRVWHDALWATMNRYNMGQKLILTIQQLYNKATSAVLAQGKIGE